MRAFLASFALLAHLSHAVPLPEELVRPAFVAGELERVTCRALEAEAQKGGSTLVTVEVSNRGNTACEPVLFRCEWKDAKGIAQTAEVARVPYPRVARIGRLAPPTGKQEYVLQLPAKEVKGLRVAVVEALFSDAKERAAPPVRVGRIEHGQGTLNEQPVARSSITLENELDHVVDVVLRAHCTAPKDADVLLTATIGPRGKGAFDVLAMPFQIEWRDPLQYWPGADVARVELVDWSARLAPDREAARALLEPAWTRWLRLADAGGAFGGRYEYGLESAYLPEPKRLRGRFTVSSSGRVSGEGTKAKDGDMGLGGIEKLVLFAHRPSFEELLAKNELELLAPGLVALRGPGFGEVRAAPGAAHAWVPGAGDSAARHLESDDAVVRVNAQGVIDAFGTVSEPAWNRLETKPLLGGYVVTAKHNPTGTERTEFGYALLGDRVYPCSFREERIDAWGKRIGLETCRLDAIAPEADAGGVAPAAPMGPGVEGLRAAWSALYRHGARAVELSARFRATNPATDGTWLGVRKVEGKLVLRGFRGFSVATPMWESPEVIVDGKFDASTASALGFAVIDRIVMWAGRDPAAFPAFDEQFRGATITRDAEREFYRSDAGSVRGVLVEGGKITRLVLRGGAERVCTWSATPQGLVATKLETSGEVLEARWSEVAKGLWLPVEFQFRGVFGRDWGPETLKLESVQAK
ncbi:MAG: hypothetical protein IPJ77_23240 [Planctomycetes bacterium]|nr:hypothetical protein [Planctomycetota bacterium]